VTQGAVHFHRRVDVLGFIQSLRHVLMASQAEIGAFLNEEFLRVRGVGIVTRRTHPRRDRAVHMSGTFTGFLVVAGTAEFALVGPPQQGPIRRMMGIVAGSTTALGHGLVNVTPGLRVVARKAGRSILGRWCEDMLGRIFLCVTSVAHVLPHRVVHDFPGVESLVTVSTFLIRG